MKLLAAMWSNYTNNTAARQEECRYDDLSSWPGAPRIGAIRKTPRRITPGVIVTVMLRVAEQKASPARLELATSASAGLRAIQLRYGEIIAASVEFVVDTSEERSNSAFLQFDCFMAG